MCKSLLFLPAALVVLLGLLPSPTAAGRHHHNNNHKLMELLTAGIVAKVLQKNEGDEGGHEYYPVPVHVPVHHHGHHGHHEHHHMAGSHHHHVTEKIIPIPIPQHTTRIIHINADKPNALAGLGGSGGDSGNSYNSGSGGYSSSNYDSSGESDDGPPRHPSGSAPSIQQIFFQDTGIYQPQPPQHRPRYHPHPMAYRRPHSPMMPMAGTHPAYMVRRYPYVASAVRPRYPPAPYAAQMPMYGASSPMYGASSSMYGMPYRRPYTAATYMNPVVVRRPYSPPIMPSMWK